MPWLDLKNCTFKIKDGASTPNEVTIKIGSGNLNWTEKKTREYAPDRGVLDEVRNADQEPMDLSFDFVWEFLKSTAGAQTPTVEEALKGTGPAASWTSVDADACAPFAVDIEVTYDPSCAGIQKEIYLFPDFRYETLGHDMRAGTVSCSGRCNVVEPTITRQT